MSLPYPSPHLVSFDGTLRVADVSTAPPEGAPDEDACKERLEELTKRFRDLQQELYAFDRYALLLVFQALDAGGKDSTIRHVMTGVNPAGFQVSSFKQPSAEELDHDFLWRHVRKLPERGRIGIFNRSWYEEVLVVRVHPELLESQRLPVVDRARIWDERLASIREHERHLARNGTVIVKFWLHVGREEQTKRFLKRLDRPDKHWKFSIRDVDEQEHREAYLEAFEHALRATSRDWAPWYAIPADDKPYMRMAVAEVVVQTLERMDIRYPEPDEEVVARIDEMRRRLGGQG